MAVASLTTDLVTLNTCDATTGWTGITPSLGSPLREGTGSCAFLVKTVSDAHTSLFAIPSTNLSNTHLRMWFETILKSRLKTFALGGIQIAMSDGTNTGFWNVSGGDKYQGGPEILTADTALAPDEGVQPNMAAITAVGFNLKLHTSAVGTVPTMWIDYIAYGQGIVVTGGTSGDEIGFTEILSQDIYYGFLRTLVGVNAFNGELILGDSAGSLSTYFKAIGEKLSFEDQVVNPSLYKIKVVGNAVGVTNVSLSGIIIFSVSDNLVLDFTDLLVENVDLDGAIIQKTVSVLCGSSTHGDGTVFDIYGDIIPLSAALTNFVLRNGLAGSSMTYPSVTDNLSNGTFICNGTDHGILISSVASPLNFNGHKFSGFGGVPGSNLVSSSGELNAAVYNDSGAHIEINISGGGQVPSVRNGAGATTTVIAAVSLLIEGSDGLSLLGAEIRIYDLDNNPAGSLGTELDGTESNAASTFTYSGVNGNEIWIQILLDGYEEFGQKYTLPVNDAIFSATLEPDVNA